MVQGVVRDAAVSVDEEVEAAIMDFYGGAIVMQLVQWLATGCRMIKKYCITVRKSVWMGPLKTQFDRRLNLNNGVFGQTGKVAHFLLAETVL